MKKNSLTTAVLAGVAGVAGLAGVAHAVNLNPDGLGQVLIYPYYTVNGGNSTLVTVVNTTDKVKAVKVRFVEALNSAEVLDFNLYMSPFDVWAANVVATGDTGAQLNVTDTSCTAPTVVNGQAFLTWEFGEGGNNPDALRGLGEPRVRQGHLEVIEMGNVVDPTLAAAATHVNGVPRDCAALATAWNSGVWFSNPHAGMEAPSGGLFGAGVIVSGEYGRTLSYNADAIDGFYRNQAATLHTNPGSVLPSLSQAATEAAGGATARVFSNGDLYELYYVNGIDAVSAVFQSRYIYNEFNLEPGLDAASEWVITFPTKRAYVYDQTPALLPFTATFPRPADPNFQGSCHNYRVNYWDREERTTQQALQVSPPRPQAGFALCWEANVLAFGQTLTADTPTRILGATPTYGAYGLTGFQFESGWARLEFDQTAGGFQYWLPSDDHLHPSTPLGHGQALIGQPVTGFWASEVVNTNVTAGIRANYGLIHKHRVSRDCRQYTAGTTSGSIPEAADVCVSR